MGVGWVERGIEGCSRARWRRSVSSRETNGAGRATWLRRGQERTTPPEYSCHTESSLASTESDSGVMATATCSAVMFLGCAREGGW